MLRPAVDLHDLDGRHLAGWFELLLPPAGEGDGWAAVFLGPDGAPVHAVRSGAGAIPPDAVPYRGTSSGELDALARSLGVGLVAVVADRGVARIAAAMEARLAAGDDLPAQGIAALRALRGLAGEAYWLEPPLHELIPPLSPEAAQRTFELLLPGRSSLVAYVVDDAARRVHASAIAVVDTGAISLVTTHRGLEDALSEERLARAWRSDRRRVVELVAARYAPVAIGLFIERRAWRRILSGPADQLTRELAAGHVVIDPAPPWLRGLLGGAQVAAAATGAVRAMSRFVPGPARRAASDLAGAAQDRLRAAGAHPFALLGFDPIALWHRVRAYYRT